MAIAGLISFSQKVLPACNAPPKATKQQLKQNVGHCGADEYLSGPARPARYFPGNLDRKAESHLRMEVHGWRSRRRFALHDPRRQRTSPAVYVFLDGNLFPDHESAASLHCGDTDAKVAIIFIDGSE
jgi:hypothetical protein